MATTPPANSGQPKKPYIVMHEDGEGFEAFENQAEAAQFAKESAKTDIGCRYIVFEAVQVFEQVAEVKMTYSRRG